MQIKILSEYGYSEALMGLGLSFGKTSGMKFKAVKHSQDEADMWRRAVKLAGIGKGHDKFLRMLTVTLDITAPLYWWKQFDTYKIGTVTQSESTMHTLMKTPITPDCFEGGKINRVLCLYLEYLRRSGDFHKLNYSLPQAYLQRRIVQTNYATLRNILEQRMGHKLPEWKAFCESIKAQAEHPDFLV